ncbi:MAG: fimbrial biogenesis outer membrane usher protein [Enterobacter sp.]|nr:fimbrial biogenesis outer membrane usher protein [Enterobacter sp.]
MRYLWINSCGFAALLLSVAECAAESEFNTSFFHGLDKETINDIIDPDSGILPGSYKVDVYVNHLLVEQRDIEFLRDEKSGRMQPCLGSVQLKAWAVNLDEKVSDTCFDIAQRFPGASVQYDMTIHRLDIQVPQKYMNTQPRGTLPATLYDDGINAAFVNYNLVANDISSNDQRDQYAYLYLNNGINLGAWRFRHVSNLTKQSGEGHRWQNVSSWAETALPSLQSRLVIGQTSTGTILFDSIPYRGVQIASDQMMRASSQAQYAPVVRGVAQSNARVEVRQNKYLIYSTNVPPGPFEFNDIVPSTRSGDLYVTIIEADGRHNNLVIPYTVLPNMVRYGQWNVEIAAGKYHDGAQGYAPAFSEGQVSYGAGDTTTLFGGVLAAENYRTAGLGLGKNMGSLGAMSVDLSLSDTHLARGTRQQGASARFLFAKSFLDSKTDFQVAGYRYSSSSYYDFQQMVQEHRRWDDGHYKTYYWDEDDQNDLQWDISPPEVSYAPVYATKKARWDATINQSLGDSSQFYLNFSKQNYWQSTSSDTTVQAGLTSRTGEVTWSLYYQNARNHYTSNDSSINLRLSVPLSIGRYPANATADINTDREGNTSSSMGLSGSLMDDRRLSYSVQLEQSRAERTSGDLGLGYAGQSGNLWLGYSDAEDVRQRSVNLSGGVVAHRGGVTLSQPLGSTFALVEAPDARGVGLGNQPGVSIDRFGYAIVPNAIPYRINTVSLNTRELPDGLEIPVASLNTVPTRGAVTRVHFETYYGESLLIHSRLADNDYPPVGAQAFSRGGRSNGIVGTQGDIFVSGVVRGETLSIRWGDALDQQCQIILPPREGKPGTGYSEIDAICR